MTQLNPKSQKKALLKNSANLKQIHDEYYLIKSFTDTVKDRTYNRDYYIYPVEEIMAKFNINSNQELLFLLHRYCGNVIKTCEFCHFDITVIKARTNDKNFNDCGCKGICILCKKIYQTANDDGVCYSCRPYHFHNEEDYLPNSSAQLRYKLGQYIGNHEYIVDCTNIQLLEMLKDYALQYAQWFEERIENLSCR